VADDRRDDTVKFHKDTAKWAIPLGALMGFAIMNFGAAMGLPGFSIVRDAMLQDACAEALSVQAKAYSAKIESLKLEVARLQSSVQVLEFEVCALKNPDDISSCRPH